MQDQTKLPVEVIEAINDIAPESARAEEYFKRAAMIKGAHIALSHCNAERDRIVGLLKYEFSRNYYGAVDAEQSMFEKYLKDNNIQLTDKNEGE